MHPPVGVKQGNICDNYLPPPPPELVTLSTLRANMKDKKQCDSYRYYRQTNTKHGLSVNLYREPMRLRRLQLTSFGQYVKVVIFPCCVRMQNAI